MHVKLARMLSLGVAFGIWSCSAEDTTSGDGVGGSDGSESGIGGSERGIGGSESGLGGLGIGGAPGSGGAGIGGSGDGGYVGLGGSGDGGYVGTGGAGTGGIEASSGGAGTDATGGSGTGGEEPASGGSGTGGEELGSGGSGTGGEEPGIGGSGTGGATSSTGCGQAPPATAPGSVDVSGVARTFIVDVPAGYDPDTPTPVLFGFHGMGNTGEAYRSQYQGNLLSTFGDEFIVVHPDALPNEDGTTVWDMQGGVDVDFFDAMVALLTATYCIDEDRLFATGHSAGGFFTNTLGCQRGDVLRGIGPQAGGGPMLFGGATCVGQVAAWISHGLSDTTVDISSGEGSRDHWAEANHCDTSQTTTPSPNYPCVEYVGCDAGYAVRWCPHEGGHEIATFPPEGLYDFFSML